MALQGPMSLKILIGIEIESLVEFNSDGQHSKLWTCKDTSVFLSEVHPVVV